MPRFGDLVMQTEGRPARRTRVTMHPHTLTAAENLLRTVEVPIASGEMVVFSGVVHFAAAHEEEAQHVARALRMALLWLPNLGAEKGVGFGRLKAARVSAPQLAPPMQKPLDFRAGDELHFWLKPLEPILVGGVKNRRSNFVESREELSGGVIKGALAVALNEAFGIDPVSQDIDPTQASRYRGFEHLAAHFHEIRVLHAFPTWEGGLRPVRKPISTMTFGDGRAYDAALVPEDVLMEASQAPAFFIDWKGWEPYIGGAHPQRVYVTRTAIDDHTRRAAGSQLFTYAFMAPVDEKHQPLVWIGNVSFAGIANATERERTKQEFIEAMRTFPLRLGKLGRPVDVTLNNGFARSAVESRARLVDGRAIITLQTDAIMLQAERVRSLKPHDDLYELYAAFWHEISHGALALKDFFAHQGFEGGYLYHRKLGAWERKTHPRNYRPYYLTRAGSVFILEARDEPHARALLETWRRHGLPWPEWAINAYGEKETAWQRCPFVPENGYGEIAINLAWHWEKCLHLTHPDTAEEAAS